MIEIHYLYVDSNGRELHRDKVDFTVSVLLLTSTNYTEDFDLTVCILLPSGVKCRDIQFII